MTLAGDAAELLRALHAVGQVLDMTITADDFHEAGTLTADVHLPTAVVHAAGQSLETITADSFRQVGTPATSPQFASPSQEDHGA